VRCLEVRARDDGIKRRTYLLDNGCKVRTYEVPEQVIAELGKSKLAKALAIAKRVQANHARQQLIKQRVREGVKPTAIAHEFGVSEQRVRQIRKELNNAS
jgi:DNA-directed RNA polymerase specialized sigma subunit